MGVIECASSLLPASSLYDVGQLTIRTKLVSSVHHRSTLFTEPLVLIAYGRDILGARNRFDYLSKPLD